MEITLEQFVTATFTRGVRAIISGSDGSRLEGTIDCIPFSGRFKMPVGKMGIYLIREIGSGCFYVGSTKNLATRRWYHQRRIARGIHWNDSLVKACCEKPKHHFEFQYFQIVDGANKDLVRKTLYAFEQEVLDLYHGSPACWNESSNSESAWLGRKRSEETKTKMAEAHRGQTRDMSGIHERQQKPVYIEGKAFRSIKEASLFLNTSIVAVGWRVRSTAKHWQNWNFVNDLWDINLYSK